MEDPFSTLQKALQSVFHFEARRNGKDYTYPEVQKLKVAVEEYKPNTKNTFIELLAAIRASLPFIAKWRINFDSVRKSMDELAKRHNMPTIDWQRFLTHPKVSPKFQFNDSNTDMNLSMWLTAKTKKPFTQLHHREVTRALAQHHKDHAGFSGILNAHLKKYPDFLFQLIMDSNKNFIEICNTRLILYLTDQQIATAIIKHIPTLVHKKSDPFEQVDQLVNTLNDILSNGRSVSTLLRNAQAKPVLLNSIFFQLYQSESYQKHQNQPIQQTLLENEQLKSNF